MPHCTSHLKIARLSGPESNAQRHTVDKISYHRHQSWVSKGTYPETIPLDGTFLIRPMLRRAHGLGIETYSCLLSDRDTSARNALTALGRFMLVRPCFPVAQYVSHPQSRQRCNSQASSCGFLGLWVGVRVAQTGGTRRRGLYHDTGPGATGQRHGRSDGGETHSDGQVNWNEDIQNENGCYFHRMVLGLI